jgi:hypothetical protein
VWRFWRLSVGVFLFGVAVCVLLFVLVCSVMGQFLSLLRFCGVGSILYRAIFPVACRRFILAYTAIPIFYHIFPFLLPFFTILRFFGHRSAQTVGFFFSALA